VAVAEESDDDMKVTIDLSEADFIVGGIGGKPFVLFELDSVDEIGGLKFSVTMGAGFPAADRIEVAEVLECAVECLKA